MQTQAVLELSENRVRRNYSGGAGIDRYLGKNNEADNDQPEDWIASTTNASNPGLAPVVNEGISFVNTNGVRTSLPELFMKEPEFYLGTNHYKTQGTTTGFLTKILDSSIRLHVQAHPDREFARKHFNSPWGKLETYVILAEREKGKGYIRLGFQHLASKAEWQRIVREQDIPAMDSCFEKIPVSPGDVWYIPGGLPHAIGEGLTVLEVMEPSDLVVRCEFEREGLVVPPAARFMGKDPDFALEIFDYHNYSPAEIKKRFSVIPQILTENESFTETLLIGSKQTDCFKIHKLLCRQDFQYQSGDHFGILIVNDGKGMLKYGGERYELSKGKKYFIAAAAAALRFEKQADQALEMFYLMK